ncbi:efflux RND transporter permease subunit, partial [Prosthecobacter sp.]|uniref:efflux RND transporter permease subunit n=1 Tax=Prosthecobacter sp. TaxID=1965333 RepID=UPI00248A3E09
MSEPSNHSENLGVAGRIAAMFIDSKLTPLVIIASVILGAAAIVLLPREEEPQIKVPMVDVMVSMPGSSAKEIEERATRPMEKLLWEVAGVEYIYSTSRDSESLVIVRFKVGEDPERSLVKITEKLRANFDRIPMGVTPPMIKPKSIDDVPILALTFHSARYDHLTLRRLAAQVDESVKQVPLVAETNLLGGARRAVRVMLDPVKLASRNLSPAGLVPMLQQANRQFRAGGLTTGNSEVLVETGAFLKTAHEVGDVVVGVFGGRPVYLREVAEILDGGEEAVQYVLYGSKTDEEPAVTLSIAKRPGANAISVADEVIRKVDLLKGSVIPADVTVSVTRNYGETAAEKSNELLLHMGIAVFSVAILIWLTLGWRESGIVAVAIPATLALTLLIFYLYGFTLNRITLFALIFSIGILVDDAIVVVENIVRHFHLPQNKGRDWSKIAVEAVGEVGNPTILATFAVIAAVLPMAFVGGLMGPYMRPIPIGASAAMFWSLLIAFIVTPWASIRILRWGGKYSKLTEGVAADDGHKHLASEHAEDFFTKLYRRMMGPLIHHTGWRWMFLIGITVLLLGAMATVGLGWVKVKMLPFDNKSEFQVILNMPEGTSLEQTTAVAREMAAAIRTEPEVTDYQIYAGVASPYNFNGLVRHYFMRRGASVADIQVNLVGKHERKAQSHDIAKRVRPAVAAIAARYGARVAIAEVPPGPPVLQTLVAEIYGPSEEDRLKLAEAVKTIFKSTPGVVDVDWYIEADQQKARFVIDKEKAALHGISAATISQTLKIAVDGETVDLLHQPEEKEDVNIRLELPRSAKTTPEELLALRVRSGDANALPEPGASGSPLVPLRELVKVEHVTVEKSRYHKNLMPVTYVIGDVAGVVESPVYAIFQMNEALKKLDTREFGGSGAELQILNASMPFSDAEPALKWDGEWHITIEVFRDLGAAFGACLILIYVLMVGWFRSFITPAIVMIAIPFSLVGILPAHGFMDAFFTATSMIGFMAGGGIVVRN